MSLEVIPYTDAHWPSLRTFLAAQFPYCAVKADERYFRWKFADHPLGSSLSGYWLAVVDGLVIGQFGVQTDQLVVDGVPMTAGNCVDLKIAADSGQPSTLWALFEAAGNQHRVLYTTTPNPQLTPVFRRFGWREVASTKNLIRVFRPSRALAVTNPQGRVARLRTWLALLDPLLTLIWREVAAFAVRPRHGLSVEPMTQFGDEIDGLVTRLGPKMGITTGRSGALWTWRFGKRPVGRHQALALRSADGALRGCIVIKLMQRPGVASWAEVVDLLVDPADAIAVRMLVWAACRQALDAGADFLRLRSSWPDLERSLQGRLWLERPGATIWAYAQDGALLDRLAQGPWMLTGAAGDSVETGRDEWAD